MLGRTTVSLDRFKSRVPRPVYPFARAVYRAALNRYYGGRLAALKKELRAQFGEGLKFDISPLDEMYRLWAEGQHDVPNLARIKYFQNGRAVVLDLARILEQQLFTPFPQKRLLDFASGYGKVTRFLVTLFDPGQITVSDIDPRAVDFIRATFHTRGFPSVTSPSDLHHTEEYDLVLVISLFSHLPLEACEAWLVKLYGLLSPGGILLFTTHGISVYQSLEPGVREEDVRRITQGFYYRKANETFGRLDVAEYGTAYVSDDYIKELICSCRLGRLCGFYPRGIDDFQDVYVVQRPA